MEGPLVALQTSLAALHAQLEHARHAQRPAYFTNAVLRGGDVDILELIRDADQLEASLFAYAPNNESTERTETPRAPQPRAVHIPTPLRQGVAGEPGEHSARFYLLAAEKLMQSYHNAPRARKHIRMLLKRDGEVQRHIQRYTSTIENAKNTPPTPSEARGKPRSPDSDALQQIRSAIQREKMEILALENILAELEGANPSTPSTAHAPSVQRTPSEAPRERKAPTPSPTARAPAPTPARSTRAPPTQQARAASARTPKTPGAGPSTPAQAPLASSLRRTPERTPATARLRRTLDGTPRPALTPSVGYTPRSPLRTSRGAGAPATPQRLPASPVPHTAASASPGRAAASPARSGARASPARLQLLPIGQAPEPTPELERIAAQLWALFGENLRYVAASERAPFAETFAALAQLECCGQDPANAHTQHDGGAAPEEAAHPPGTPSPLAGAQNAPAPAGAVPQPSAPLSVTTVVMAHVLLLLFRAPAPHTLTLPSIKALTESWWRQRGQSVFRATAGAPTLAVEPVRHLGLDATDVELGGDALGARAVYGLVAKKLLRISRAGGAATIRFA